MTHTQIAVKVGFSCAQDANNAAGRIAWNDEGASILPRYAEESDWQTLEDRFAEDFDREPNRDEREAFCNAYEEQIEKARRDRFAYYVNAVRNTLRWNQQQLADALDFTRQTVYRWERGDTAPDRMTERAVIQTLRRICKQRARELHHISASVAQEPQSADTP